GIFVQLPFQGIGILGMYRLLVDVLHGRKADIGRMFKNMHLLGRYVVLQLLIHAIVTIPVFLAMAVFGYVGLRSAGLTLGGLNSHSVDQLVRSPAPFIFFGGWLLIICASILVLPITMLSIPELLVSECEPMEALQRAWKMGEGNRLRLFGYSFVSGVIIFVGLLACCVGAIPASAAAYMLLIALFLVIRRAHADLPPIVDKP
ncbi:MAG: hypothetical protein JNM17_27400, partial [Archangium sp.]|nr:hypothetical protein [Archangium sp.]